MELFDILFDILGYFDSKQSHEHYLRISFMKEVFDAYIL